MDQGNDFLFQVSLNRFMLFQFQFIFLKFCIIYLMFCCMLTNMQFYFICCDFLFAKSNLQVSEYSNFVFLFILNSYFCFMQYNYCCHMKHWISCNYVFSFIVPRLCRLILVFLFSLENKKFFSSTFFAFFLAEDIWSLFLPVHLKVIPALVNYFCPKPSSNVRAFHVQH